MQSIKRENDLIIEGFMDNMKGSDRSFEEGPFDGAYEGQNKSHLNKIEFTTRLVDDLESGFEEIVGTEWDQPADSPMAQQLVTLISRFLKNAIF